MLNYSEHDIGRQLARDAFRGTSHTPEKRGDFVIKEYLAHMQEVEEEFKQWLTDDNQDELVADLEAYRAKYVELKKAYLRSHSNVVSAFIAGPANFPTQRMRKRSDWADKHRARLVEFSEKRLRQLRRKYDPKRIAHVPISSDDPDAISKLKHKIEEAERLQELMKSANRVVRKKKLTGEERKSELVALGLTEKQVAELLTPDYIGKIGFPGYALTNNNANIRRMKSRVRKLEAASQDKTESIAVGEVHVVDAVDVNRVRIFFPDKPDIEIRNQLKSHGFRWAPSVGAWQRHRSAPALQLAQEIAAEY